MLLILCGLFDGFVSFTRAFQPPVVIRVHGGGPESTKFINLIPPIAATWLLQYSGFRVEHRDGFSSHK